MPSAGMPWSLTSWQAKHERCTAAAIDCIVGLATIEEDCACAPWPDCRASAACPALDVDAFGWDALDPDVLTGGESECEASMGSSFTAGGFVAAIRLNRPSSLINLVFFSAACTAEMLHMLTAKRSTARPSLLGALWRRSG